MSDTLGYWVKPPGAYKPVFIPYSAEKMEDVRLELKRREAIKLECEKVAARDAARERAKKSREAAKAKAERLRMAAMQVKRDGGVPSASLVAALCEEAAARAGIEPRLLMMKIRGHKISHTRMRVWAALRERGYSYPGIGRVFGVDHTSVLHGVRRLKELEAE